MEQKSNLNQTSKYFSEDDLEFLKMINDNTSNLIRNLSESYDNSNKDKMLKKESVGSEKSK